jgi:hypothetical protein
MRVRYRHQRQRARVRTFLRILRYQSRARVDLVEIFDDRQRLEHGVAIVNKCRHDPLGIDGRISRLELLAGENVDRGFLERQILKLERDPHPE